MCVFKINNAQTISMSIYAEGYSYEKIQKWLENVCWWVGLLVKD